MMAINEILLTEVPNDHRIGQFTDIRAGLQSLMRPQSSITVCSIFNFSTVITSQISVSYCTHP